MFDAVQTTTGRKPTKTVAWLVIALTFIPAALSAVRPGHIWFFMTAACSAMVWTSWKKSLTRPCFAPQKAAAK